MAAKTGSAHRSAPIVGLGNVVALEPAGVRHLERMEFQFTADGATEEQERIERNARLTETHAVEHADESHRFSLDARLFQHLFHDDFRGRSSQRRTSPSGTARPPSRLDG
jgi:hypothetical protein